MQAYPQNAEEAAERKKQYDKFYRSCRKSGGMPAVLNEMYQTPSGRNNLFNLWLDNKGDMEKCAQVIVKRKAEQETRGKDMSTTMKKRDLVERYGEEKALVVMSACKRSGAYQPDKYFPNDEEETKARVCKRIGFQGVGGGAGSHAKGIASTDGFVFICNSKAHGVGVRRKLTTWCTAARLLS